MSLTAKLAFSQIKTNRNRSVMTLLGIVLSSAMLTAVCGYVASAKVTLYNAFGYESDAAPHAAIIAMGAVLGAIIVTASVIVVSNAFRVSAGERTRQFGILKSVGATKKQIAESVLYEGVFLSAIGIPVGIAIGLLIDLIGTSILTNMLHSLSDGGTLNVDSDALLTVPFVTPPLMFLVAIAVSFGTVLLSAWLPARKAANIPAIDAIRSAGEVKLQGKSFRTSKLTRILFGYEGELAAKSLKRSRRSFRATVVSLTISIIMLISAGSFGTLMERSTGIAFVNINATTLVLWSSDVIISTDDAGNVTAKDYLLLDSETAETITGKLREYDGAEIFSNGTRQYRTTLPDGTMTDVSLISVDAKRYQEMCKAADVPAGSHILINLRREASAGFRKEYSPYKFSELKGVPLTFALTGHDPEEIVLSGELTGQIPDEINLYGLTMLVIAPSSESVTYTWYADVDDMAGFSEYATQVLNEFAPPSTDKIHVYAECQNIAAVAKQMRDLVSTIMLFVYGFVGMLTLIAVTSVISTISTNIRSRAREFAVFESIGMTKPGMKKMLNLESILCSVRSLLYGIPLGLITAYALYLGAGAAVEFPFEVPFLSMAACTLGVFAVTWITMRYSADRLKDGNIIETIRGE